MASPFKGLDNTKPAGDFEYIRAGRYLARINEFRFGTTRKGVGYARFGFTIVNVLDPSEAAKDPKGPHRVGEKVSWMLMANIDASAPALKSALMTIMESPAEEITDAFSESAASDAQPLAGLFVDVSASLKATKTGGMFTLVQVKRRVLGAEVKKIASPEVLASLRLTDIKDDE